MHYEGELAVVIGRICRDVPREQANDVIFGYTSPTTSPRATCRSARTQWARAKGFDSFCPLGPWIETDLDPADLADGVASRPTVNGDLRAGRPHRAT